jgi:hypothetical protein
MRNIKLDTKRAMENEKKQEEGITPLELLQKYYNSHQGRCGGGARVECGCTLCREVEAARFHL